MEKSTKFNTNILGIDIGNATVKTNTGYVVDSKVTTIEPLSKCDKLFIEGKTLYIGEGEFDTTYRKIDKKIYIPLLYNAIANSSNNTYNKIVLALPLSQYKTDKENLINLVMSNNDKWIELNDYKRHIVIEDVEVFPEGVFTVNDDYEGIIIDIGGRTTDAAMIEINRGKKKILDPISIPTGTINLYSLFVESINNKMGLDLKIRDAERILKNGLILDGNYKNIDFAYNVFTDYVEDLVSQLQVKYSIRTNIISLTGGGATLTYEYFKRRIGNNVIKQDNCLMANANNLYELGTNIF